MAPAPSPYLLEPGVFSTLRNLYVMHDYHIYSLRARVDERIVRGVGFEQPGMQLPGRESRVNYSIFFRRAGAITE